MIASATYSKTVVFFVLFSNNINSASPEEIISILKSSMFFSSPRLSRSFFSPLLHYGVSSLTLTCLFIIIIIITTPSPIVVGVITTFKSPKVNGAIYDCLDGLMHY